MATNKDNNLIISYNDNNCDNTNVTIYYDLFYNIDQTILTGNTEYIENALKLYGNQLHPDSIKMATSIIVQILEEKMEEMVLTSNC